MARLRVKRRSPQESQPAQHRSSPSCFRCICTGWPCLKDGRRSHAQISPFQRPLTRLRRPAEGTACTGGNQPSDRDSWSSSVRKASCEFEAERHKASKEKPRRQKERAASLPSSSQTSVCPKCGRECASRIGLYSHQRACNDHQPSKQCSSYEE